MPGIKCTFTFRCSFRLYGPRSRLQIPQMKATSSAGACRVDFLRRPLAMFPSSCINRLSELDHVVTIDLLSSPTELELAILGLAPDLKVSGFGQRTRAALRRNRDANDDTFLPHAAFKDIPGPDLVRHLNAISIVGASDADFGSQLGSADDQLLAALQRQLAEAQRFVARLWDGPLSAVAASFVDYDNLPVPFCPMYPNARELRHSHDLTLARPLESILGRLRYVLFRTDAYSAAVAYVLSADSPAIARLAELKQGLMPELAARSSETYAQWSTRASGLVEASRNEVPSELLHVNNLINATVGSLVSLSVWDHSLSDDDVRSAERWPADSDRGQSSPVPDDDLDDAGEAFTLAVPPMPRGHELCVTDPRLFLPMDTAIQMRP